MCEIAVFAGLRLVVLVLIVLLEWFLVAIFVSIFIIIRLDLWWLSCYIPLWRSLLWCLSRSWSTFWWDLRFNVDTRWFLESPLGGIFLVLQLLLVHNWLLWWWKIIVDRLTLIFWGEIGALRWVSCVWRLVVFANHLLLEIILVLLRVF